MRAVAQSLGGLQMNYEQDKTKTMTLGPFSQTEFCYSSVHAQNQGRLIQFVHIAISHEFEKCGFVNFVLLS